MQPWKRLSEPEIIKVGWRTLSRKSFEQPDGKPAEYVTVGGVGARHGAVIAVTPDNKVVIARQFRPGPEMIFEELPGGNIENGEKPQAAVMRELREETGYSSDEVIFLGEARKDAYLDATWYFYLAKNCKQAGDQALDDGEFVEVDLITIDQLIENAKSSHMSDGIAVLMAYETLQSLKEKS